MLDRKTPATAAFLIASAVVLGGCAGAGGPSLGPATAITTGSLGSKANPVEPADASKPEAADRAAALSTQAAVAKGGEPSASMSTLVLARALREKGEKVKALAELERGRKEKPADRELAREAGLVALELGQIDKAKKALTAALDPARPDFHTLAALGTAHASAGNQQGAQAHYTQALKIKPEHRATLNNLALSYALDGDLAKAESTLKMASKGAQSSQQIKENLAVVMALAGKFDDAEKAAAGVMPKAKVAANMAYLRSLTEKERGG